MSDSAGRDPESYPDANPLPGPSADSDPVLARCALLLTPEETDRAARFRFERHRRSFILRRAALRILVGHYLGTAPESLTFASGSHGKPILCNKQQGQSEGKGANPQTLHFNTSHTTGIAVFAFTLGSEIGVDVELSRAIEEMAEMAQRFFCPEEARELMDLPAPERQAAFFRCWTRKEAYLKATGAGLSEPLDSFQVTLRPGEEPRFIHVRQDRTAARSWSLHHIEIEPRLEIQPRSDPRPQYIAALAYKDTPRPVRMAPVATPAELLTLIR